MLSCFNNLNNLFEFLVFALCKLIFRDVKRCLPIVVRDILAFIALAVQDKERTIFGTSSCCLVQWRVSLCVLGTGITS